LRQDPAIKIPTQGRGALGRFEDGFWRPNVGWLGVDMRKLASLNPRIGK
jgi:hypothetical protein